MFSLPYMRVLVPIITLVGIIALGAYVHLTLKEARYLYSGPVVISVVGDGEVTAVADIASFSFGVTAEGEDAVTAQSASAEKMNAILDYLKGAGIEEKDIKTEYYNQNPQYEYPQQICAAGMYCPPGERTLTGYEVTQSVSVKVRETDTAGDLIAGVTERGATNVSGVNFTIDDENVLMAEARAAAVADAKEKAEALADSLGVDIVRMTGFWENQPYYDYGYGMGGDMKAMSESSVSPNLPSGENTITSQVNISYEVK